jgi:hypothetical protein
MRCGARRKRADRVYTGEGKIMQIRSGARFAGAFASLFMLAGSAAAAEPASAIDALRNIAVRVDAATRETVAAHAEHRAVAIGTADATKRARSELDALVRAATMQGFASDVAFARKHRQVGKLLANLGRAEASAADAALPPLVATNEVERTSRITLAAGRGSSCVTALTIAPGRALETNLAAAGDASSTLWLRVTPAAKGYTRLDTMPTPLDTEITLFGAACPSGEADATMRNDDAFGLAAAVAMDATGGVRYARVRNLGRAGRVVARVETAAAVLGRITDARDGHALPATVDAVTPDGFYGSSTMADGGSGLYLLTVDPGSYYIMANDPWADPTPYVPELYPDAPCQSTYFDQSRCDVADATVLTLADGQQVAGIDVALNIGGRIAGTVRNADDGTPIAGATVGLFDASGNPLYLYVSPTDAAGRYSTAGLLTGSYYVLVTASGHGSQLWNHVDCGGALNTDCSNVLDGTPLAVIRDQLASGIDFDLPRNAHIHATISARAQSNIPISTWWLSLYLADGTYVGQYYSYGTDAVDTDSLAPGTYHAFTSVAGYFGQVWNGIDCAGDCTQELPGGTPITLTAGTEADIAFSLLPIPTVSGTITDAATHAPLAGIQVALVPVDSSYPANNVYTDYAGHYEVWAYQAGDYYVWATDVAHRGTVYPAAPCGGAYFESCDTSTATPFTLSYGGTSVTGADIAMPVNGSIAGHVEMRLPDGMTLPPIVPTNENIAISDLEGNYVGSASTDIDGNYAVVGLPAGTYYALASGYGFAQVYDGLDCAYNCQPGDGTPITIAQGEAMQGIDFDPIPNDSIFGRVTDAGDVPVAGVAIDQWNALDGSHCGVGITNADGYYSVHDTSFRCYGTNRLSTDTDLFENQVFNGIYCPNGSAWLGLCSLDSGTDVLLPSTPEFVIANFILGPRPDAIYANGFEP